MVAPALFSSATDLWSTPQDFYDKLDREWGFLLDVCATRENAKAPIYFTQEQDGLAKDWAHVIKANGYPGRKRVWMNPPYGREIGKWMKKAHEEAQKGLTVVCLVPARTDTKWWHDHVWGHATVEFVRGRLKFGGSKNSAPFPSAVVIYNYPEVA